MPSAAFNVAQLAVIGTDGQLPKLDLAFLLRFYAESHVGIPAVLQVVFQSVAPRNGIQTPRPLATLQTVEASDQISVLCRASGLHLSPAVSICPSVQRSLRRC